MHYYFGGWGWESIGDMWGMVVRCCARGYWAIVCVNWEGIGRSMEFEGCGKFGDYTLKVTKTVSIWLVRVFQEYFVQ